MRIHSPLWRVGVILSLAVLMISTGCGATSPEATPTDAVVAVYTQAAATAFAALTQTAQYFTPTPEPTATFTPLPPTPTPDANATPTATATSFTLPPLGGGQPTLAGPLCDDMVFEADITIPDYTEMTPGQTFVKTWKVRNNGTCAWDDGYYLGFAYGDLLGGSPWYIVFEKDYVDPGEAIYISIPMVAPNDPGTYYGHWRMVNDRNTGFGMELLVIIVIK